MESSSSSASAAMEPTDSGCSTPYMTAPSSPPRLNSATFFSQFGHNPSLKDANFTLPPPSPSSTLSSPKHDHNTIDFAFHFTNIFHDTPCSAEDLFHHGKIKPFKSSSSMFEADHSETEQVNDDVVFKTANSSPRRKRKDIDFAFSSDDDELRINRRSPAKREFYTLNTETPSFDNSSAFEHAKAQPFQLSQMLFDEDEEEHELAKQSNNNVKTLPKTAPTTSFWKSFSLTKAYRKWKLKDLLFRSASEGRSTDKVAVDPALMNYAILTKSKSREAAASFRSSSDGSSSMKGLGSGSGRRRGGSGGGVPVSAHELHYTVNRAVSEEMKRKTFLPYKQSLLGCLGFNPGHHFPGRVGSMARV